MAMEAKKKKFSANSDIFDYSLSDALESIKYEHEKNKPYIKFENNISKFQFYTYFFELASLNNEISEASIIDKYIKLHFDLLPKTIDETIKRVFLHLDLDCSAITLFKKTSPIVITAFLYKNLSELLYDELLLFLEDNPFYFMLQKHYKCTDVKKIIYNIILDAATNLDFDKYDCEDEIEPIVQLSYIELQDLKDSPKNLQEAIDWLLDGFEKNNKVDYKQLKSIDDREILCCYLFKEVYHIVYKSFFLDIPESPLRIYYKQKYKTNDSFFIAYDIIRTFLNVLLLKNNN